MCLWAKIFLFFWFFSHSVWISTCFITSNYWLQGWTIESLQHWNQFTMLAAPGTLMLCVEWWSFVVGIVLMGKCVSSLYERRKNRDYSMERVRERFLIYKLQTIKKTNERASAVSNVFYFIHTEISSHLNSKFGSKRLWKYIVRLITDTNDSTSQCESQYVWYNHYSSISKFF